MFQRNRAFIPNIKLNKAGGFVTNRTFSLDAPAKRSTYGEKDITLTDYLSEPKRYADLWNAGIFQGRQVIFVRFWNRRQNTAKIKTEEIDICKAITDLIADGKTEGISQGITRGIQALIETCKELGVSKRDTLNKVMQKFSCTEEESDKYMTLYWK